MIILYWWEIAVNKVPLSKTSSSDLYQRQFYQIKIPDFFRNMIHLEFDTFINFEMFLTRKISSSTNFDPKKYSKLTSLGLQTTNIQLIYIILTQKWSWESAKN